MMCKCGVVLSISVVIVSSLILLVNSFNVDTLNYVQHQGSPQSMFGFSVATHKEQGRSWVLVGAPTAQRQQSRIFRGGAVFKCSTSSDNACEEVDFIPENNTSTPYQWLGATISSAGPDGPVVACAPRYVWINPSEKESRVGTCYIATDNFKHFSEYSPCRTSLHGHPTQGPCQAGFSAGISKTLRPHGCLHRIGEWAVIQQSLDGKPPMLTTPEGTSEDGHSYLGYSAIVGDFNSAGAQGIAVGMPKGGDLLEGKVLLYTWNLTNYLNITSEPQMGSYFGYALAVSDVDGDGRDDLIIGAPMHTQPHEEMKYEVGRVYVAYQGNSNYAHRDFLDGFNSKSRFGLALSTLGDMNLDGYGDFAVGAPYDGPNERGAVYIFQGSSNGVIKKYSQVIYAEDVQGSFGDYSLLSTFGFSIAGGLDLDGNDYPDVAVGAYYSDTAYVFRARPVIRIEALVKFDNPKVVHLDNKTCNKPDDPATKVPCTWIQVCMKYTGVGAPQRIDLNLHYLLDAQKSSHSRIYSSISRGNEARRTVTLYKDTPFNCDPSLRDTIYLKESIADKLTDLEIQVRYSLKDLGSNYENHQRDSRGILLPIIDLSTPSVVNDTISIFKNCGADNVCIPDLHLSVRKEVSKYLYDAEKPIEFEIEVTNTEDDSYNTKFYVELPHNIVFLGASLTDNTPFKRLSCSPTFNASIISCDIGNPLVNNARMQFKLRVMPKGNGAQLKPTNVFYMNVTSANPEHNTMHDNSVTISVDNWVDAILEIEGKSVPATVYYKSNLSEYKAVTEAEWDNELGPSVIHQYTVVNEGPSAINEAEIFIIWPWGTLSGDDLLYLTEPPHTTEGVRCETIDTNVGELAVALQRDIWDIVDIDRKGNINKNGIQTERLEESGATIVRTISVLRFYDRYRKPVHVMEVTEEPGSENYWKQVSVSATQFPGPLTVEGNSSVLVIKYSEGREITRTEYLPGSTLTMAPFTSYIDDVGTVITYEDANNNLLYSETVKGELTREEKERRASEFSKKFKGDFKLKVATTKIVTFRTTDGQVLHTDAIVGSRPEDTDHMHRHSQNLQDLNVNQGAFAKGTSFRDGSVDLGSNSENVDQSIDGQAESNFESYSESQSYDGNHDYISGVQTSNQHEASAYSKHYVKRKRGVDGTDNDIEKLSQCTTTKCLTIRCVSGPMPKGHEVHIALRARVVVQALKSFQMSTTEPVDLRSTLLARISKFQDISGLPAQNKLYRSEIVTVAKSP